MDLQKSEALQHREGPVARTIERQTAKLPSDVFLWTGIGCGIASAVLMLQGRKSERRFAPLLGELMPTFLLLGIYNKLVKIAGSDGLSEQASRLGRDVDDQDDEMRALH